MTKQRVLIRTIIVETVFFAILISLLSVGLYSFFADAKPIFLSYVLIIPYYGMCYFRKTRNFAIFVGAHIALAAWPLLLPVIWTPRDIIVERLPNAPLSSILTGINNQVIAPLRICWLVFLLFSMIRSVAVRLKGSRGYETGYLFFSVGLLTLISIVAGYFEMNAITALNAIWAFVLIAGFILHNQTVRIDESLEILTSAGKKPVNAIIRFNNAIIAVFFIPVALFAAISPWIPIDRIAKLFADAAIAALRAIFGFIGWLLSLLPKKAEEMVMDTPQEAPDIGGFMNAAQEPNAFLKLLETIFFVLIVILVVAAAAAGIAYAAYKLYRRFLATRVSGGGGDDGTGDVSEYIGPAFAPKPLVDAIGAVLRRFAPKTEEEKIRWIYYKRVRRHIKRGFRVALSDTAGEIADKLRPTDDIDELTAQYNRARYHTIKSK